MPGRERGAFDRLEGRPPKGCLLGVRISMSLKVWCLEGSGSSTGFAALKPQTQRCQASEAQSVKTAWGHLEPKLLVASGLFESQSPGVTTAPGAPHPEGKGTEPYPNKARVLEAEATVWTWGKYDPGFPALNWKETWASQSPAHTLEVSFQRRDCRVSDFPRFCIQIQQAITKHLTIPRNCVMLLHTQTYGYSSVAVPNWIFFFAKL